MNKVCIKVSALVILAMLLATSCTKTGATGPAGASGPTGGTGPNLTGNLQGIVFLYAADGTKQLGTTLMAGDSITLTNNSDGTTLKTTTDANGAYTFTNVTTGTYSLTVSKPLYGTVWSQGVQFAGGGNASRNYALSQIPTTTVSTATAVDTSLVNGVGATAENYVTIRGYVPVSAGGTTVIVFVSVPANTSVNSTPGNFSTNYTVTVAPGVSKFRINIPTNSLYDLGFVSGNTVYFAAYIVGGNTSASAYTDLTTGQAVFTALSPAAVNASALVQ